MRRLVYKVGRDGYYTYIPSYQSALVQQAQDPKYTIEAVLENVPEERTVLSPIRKAMLEQFGYVSASLKDKVVL